MILASLIHFFSLSAALIGVFGSTSTVNAEGKRNVTWVGWGAIGVALGMLVIQLSLSIKNEESSIQRTAEIAGLLNNTDQIVEKSQRLEDNLVLALENTKIANEKAKELSFKLDNSLQKNTKYLESAIQTTVKSMETGLSNIVTDTKNSLKDSVNKSTLKLSRQMEGMASEREIKQIISASVERKLEHVKKELDNLLRELSSMQREVKKKNKQIARTSTDFNKNIISDVKSVKKDLGYQLKEQSRDIDKIISKIEGFGRDMKSIQRKLDQVQRSVK